MLRGISVTSVNNVFAVGTSAMRRATTSGVGALYCLAGGACMCLLSTATVDIQNVKTNIYAIGEWSMILCQISDVGNSIIANGDASMYGATVNNATNVK